MIDSESACVGQETVFLGTHMAVPAIGGATGRTPEAGKTPSPISQGNQFLGVEPGLVAVRAGRCVTDASQMEVVAQPGLVIAFL